MYMDPDGHTYIQLHYCNRNIGFDLCSDSAWVVLVQTYHIERRRAPLPSFYRPQVA
jgi:hypothetical protein